MGTYSFSKLSSFNTCPYCWYLKYIEHKSGKTNAFSSYGSFVHKLLERYAKGEVKKDDLAFLYEWEYEDSIPEEFPPNAFADLSSLYYNQGLDFFKQFNGFDDYEIVGSEIKFEIEIGNSKFVGIIDLLLKDKSGDYIIVDYKSKGKFKSKKEKAEYARQLYIYAAYVKEQYGVYPKQMYFCLIRARDMISIKFNESDFNEAMQWVINTEEEIENTWAYDKRPDDFFCYYLCEFRDECNKEAN